MADVRVVTTGELGRGELDEVRALMAAAFEHGFTDNDWAHTLGGRHAIVRDDGELVAHGALIERTLEAGGRRLRTGYVEGVATAVDRRRQGHGSAAMEALQRVIRAEHELGGLSTGVPAFYEALGWERWLGRTFVATDDGRRPTQEDDDSVMVLRTARTPDLDVTADLVCEWRPGDVW